MNTLLAEKLAEALGICEQTTTPATIATAPASRKVTVADGNPATLTSKVEKIIIQCSFKLDFLVPSWVYREKDETGEERTERKELPLKVPGIQFIQNTRRTDGSDLRQKLINEGFALVDGRFQERVNGATGKVGYHMVRFTFYRTVKNVSDAYREILDQEVGPSLDTMLKQSLWRVRAYNNPLVQKGEVVEGKRTISINLEFPERPGRENAKVLTVRNQRLVICE